MTWYAAHAVIWIKKKVAPERRCHFWENVILIEAPEEVAAMEKAIKRAKEDTADDPSFRVDGEPGELVFVGIRKLIEIRSLDGRDEPNDGAEVTYSEMAVSDHSKLVAFANGEEVVVRHIE